MSVGMLYIFLSVSSDLSEVTYFFAIILTQCAIFVIWRAFGAFYFAIPDLGSKLVPRRILCATFIPTPQL